MGHFNLETVSIGMNLRQINFFQGGPPKAFEATGRVRERHPGYRLNIFRSR